MAAYTYRIGVTADVEVHSDKPLTRGDLQRIGGQIASGNQQWTEVPDGFVDANPLAPLDDHVAVSIEIPYCASEHPVGGHDGVPPEPCSQRAAPADDAVHGAAEECGRLYGCRQPEQHHAYVSPGFDAPAGPN